MLHRSQADWPVVLAAGLLLLSATTLLATGSLYTDTVALGGLRRAILDAPPADRAIVVATTLLPGDLDRVGVAVDAELRRAIAVTGGTVDRVVRSASWADAAEDPDQVSELTNLAAYDGIADHSTLVAGAWPVAGGDPVEATLSEGAAVRLGLGVGDEVRLVGRRDPSLKAALRVVGVWRPLPDDPYWLGQPLELDGVEDVGSFITRGPFVLDGADLLPGELAPRLEAEWRSVPDIDALELATMAGLRADIAALGARLGAGPAGGRQLRIGTALPGIIDGVERAVLVARGGVLLLTIQFGVLGVYAVVLVGGLLLERRRMETALLRSRGAGSGHLLSMAVAEALLLALPAALVAPWLAAAIVNLLTASGPLAAAGIDVGAAVTPSVLLVSALAGLAGTAAIALPVLTSGVSLAGVRAALGRQGGRTLPQRLGVDVALVALAGIGLWQLRLYGAPLTRNARGVLGVDPLLVAAPAIGLLAGGILAIRVIPRLAEIAERVLERGRGLVAPLGGRQLARRPLRYSRSALLLMLAGGLATFASAHAATWTSSQADQAAYLAAGDMRVVVAGYSDMPDWAFGPAYRSIDGVVSATPVERHDVDSGPKVRGAPLLAIGRMAGNAAPGTVNPVSAIAARLAGGRPAIDAVELPGTPARLALRTREDFVVTRFDDGPAVPARTPAVRGSVVVQDADGRIHRFTGGTGPLVGDARIDVPLRASAGALDLAPAYPLRLLDVELQVISPSFGVIEGSFDLLGVDLSEASSGDDWRPVAFDPKRDWSWLRFEDGNPNRAARPESDAPWSIVVSAEDGAANPPVYSTAVFRLTAQLSATTAIPAFVGNRYLERTGARIGETVTVTSRGTPIRLELVGGLAEFAPQDPEEPFVVVDAASLDLIRFVAHAPVARTSEWWLDLEADHEADVVATLAGTPYSAGEIIAREARTRELTSDPVSLGVIGVLGLGAAAALVFAAIGFAVSATVSASERIGEFALLQALGLSGRQLSIWLSLESAFLLVVGLVAGSALGFLLAWLVLPFATLTQTGAAAVPSPQVVIPWQALTPAWLGAVVLLVVTILAIRRQLPARRISGVLRARDE